MLLETWVWCSVFEIYAHSGVSTMEMNHPHDIQNQKGFKSRRDKSYFLGHIRNCAEGFFFAVC